MEYPHGLRRNIRFSREEEDQEDDNTTPKNPFLSHHPSSSSSPSSAPPPPFIEKEHMFDKVVTPSDVGKLNRLVLPKQYAEKFFPLDSTANEKGLLLNFEDRNGKPWRFRYSYWNSSQSYVMTKGWSRFVKEKRLDAGDVVSFGRGVGETGRDRLFIDWKRRPEAGLDPPRQLPRVPLAAGAGHGYPLVSFNRGRLFVPPGAVYHDHHHVQGGVGGGGGGGGYFYFPGAAVAPHGGVRECKGSVVLESVPVGHGQAAAKRVRLFGVNLECPEGDVAAPERVAPHLQLRLGGADSSLQEEGDSRLDLDL